MRLADHTRTWRPEPATTLQALVAALGGAVLHVFAAPRGLDVPIGGTAIYDPADPVPESRDAVLLLVGTRVDTPQALEAVESAAERGFAAVVVKLRGRGATDLVTAASARGVAVLVTADEMPWRRLDGLMASVLGAGRLPTEVTGGGGEALFALANTMAALIGGSVAIEDLEQHVLAYSSIEEQRIDPLRERGILDRRVPDYPHHRAQYLQVLQSPGVARFPELGDELPRAAVAIRAGDLPLGTIWAIEDTDGLGPAGERALLDGARIAALHMLRGQDVHEREQRLRGEVLRSTLAGASPLEDAGERLGLAQGAEYALVGFCLIAPEDQGMQTLRVGAACDRYVVAYSPEAITAMTPEAVYVLVPGSAISVRRFAEGALPSLQRAGGAELRAAMSAPSHEPTDLLALRREVDAVLRAAAADDRAPYVATVSDVHTRLVLDRMADLLVADPRLRHPGIERLIAHDDQHGTDYGCTALAWLDAQCDMRSAAEQLTVHPNTLRYRLRRLQERFDLDLSDPDIRLSAWLQLRATVPPGSPP